MNVGMNLANVRPYTPSPFADRMLSSSGGIIKSGTITAGATGWPTGPGVIQINAYLDPDAIKSYTVVVTKGQLTNVMISQMAGIGLGKNINAKVVNGIAHFEAQGRVGESSMLVFTTAGTEETRWALVRTDELDTWRADPLSYSPEWAGRLKGFACLRFMDWMNTNGSKLAYYPESEPYVRGSLNNQVPISLMLKLSRQIGAQPWIPLPVQITDDGVVDMLRRIDKSDKPNFELGNELWNLTWLANKYAKAQEQALIDKGILQAEKNSKGVIIAPSGQRWYAYRSEQISKLIQSQGWKLGVDFDFSIGCQPVQPELSAKIFSTAPAKGNFTRWMVTNYIHGDLSGDFNKTVAMVKNGDFDAAFSAIESSGTYSLKYLADNLAKHKKIADDNGLELVCYEGNMNIAPVPKFSNTALTNANAVVTQGQVYDFYTKLMMDPRMGDIMAKNLDVCDKAGVSLCCLYNDQQKWSDNGLWGIYGTPAWDAMKTYIAENGITKPDFASLLAEVRALEAKILAAIK